MARDVLLVLSGGLDSTTMAYVLAEQYSCRAVYVDYGKEISPRELAAAKLVSHMLDMPIDIVGSEGITRMQYGYLPWTHVRSDESDIKGWDGITRVITQEEAEALSKYPAGSPHWYHVSGLHQLVSIATYLAQLIGISDIALAITKEQSIAMPGLGRALIKWSECIELLNPASGKFNVLTPFIDHKKSEIVKTGAATNVPFEITWSCITRTDMHCGKCIRCIERKEAFQDASIPDPTSYAPP